MIRHSFDVSDTAPARQRSKPGFAFAGVGLLASAVVATWGSFFAYKTLYPSYRAAFHAPAAVPATPATLGTTLQGDIMQTAMKRDADIPPVAPLAEPDARSDLQVTPVKLPVPNAVEIDPPQTAAVDTAPAVDAGLEIAAAPRAAETPAAEDLTAEGARLGHAPLDADTTAETAPVDLAVATSPRPAPRPAALVVDATPDATLQAASLMPDEDAPTEEAPVTTSTMNAASVLAVLSSPRPKGVPRGLRLAALTAPTARIEPETTAPDQTVQASARTDPGLAPAPRVSGNSCGRNHARNMPNRRGGAQTGSAFIAALGNGSGSARDNAIINELARGNMPSFLKNLQPVVLRGRDARGAAAEIVICVTPDYLALGSDRDFVRVPLGLPAAASIAGRFGMMLPTSRMVDAIYSQSRVRLSPQPMQAGPQMSSTNYFLRHNTTIEGQRQGRTGLVAGHKKDVVMANRMASNPGRVAIYGWHRSNGNPIQPVSTVHGASYADYSHGIRLVSRTAYLNGRAVQVETLLSDGRYAYLLNSDGPMPGPVIRVASR